MTIDQPLNERENKAEGNSCPGNQAYNQLLDAVYSRVFQNERMGDFNSLKKDAPCLSTESDAISLMNENIKKISNNAFVTDATKAPEIKRSTETLPALSPSVETKRGPVEVNGENIPEGTTYIALNDMLGPNSANDLAQSLIKKDQNGKSALDTDRSIIMDLRSNPGGTLTIIREQASVLVGEKSIGSLVMLDVNDRRNVNDERLQGSALTEPLFNELEKLTDKEIIVLANKQTAGGAELLATALRDHRKAIIVGTGTHGLGEVSVSERIGNAQVTYPIGQLYDNSGQWLGYGVTPDVHVESSSTGDAQLKAAIDLLLKK